MTEHQNVKEEKALPEDEHYEVLTPMRRKDVLGVVIALAALVLIGAVGYIWLTPGMNISTFFHSGGKAVPVPIAAQQPESAVADLPPQPSDSATMGTPQQPFVQPMEQEPSMAAMEHETPPTAPAGEETKPGVETSLLTDPHLHDHDLNCAYCGMFADKSLSHSVVQWNDGSHTHHDGWDCVFKYGQDAGLVLEDAVVVQYDGTGEEPVWIAANEAWFLYGTKTIKGSMPPFVAAFESEAAAQAAKAELGGEVLGFVGLSNKWG
jgi:hypothetical protein